jgi:gamma-glutamylcyclotransferase (GGCT)/AIG2-like uncharacterized protein YtfP
MRRSSSNHRKANFDELEYPILLGIYGSCRRTMHNHAYVASFPYRETLEIAGIKMVDSGRGYPYLTVTGNDADSAICELYEIKRERRAFVELASMEFSAGYSLTEMKIAQVDRPVHMFTITKSLLQFLDCSDASNPVGADWCKYFYRTYRNRL